MLDENLIATLEQSLRQTRNAQDRLLARLREVEAEAEKLRQEIQALENSAAQTEQAIYSLLTTMRSSGARKWEQREIQGESSYEEMKHFQRTQVNTPRTTGASSYSSSVPRTQVQQPIAPIIEPMNRRFADRTITQACTLLLREAGRPLHVNELYKLLVAGGMEFKGNNPTISIAVSLNRNRRFRKVAPGTFDLVMRDASQIAS
jgi:light-regulated signal transduction histidine kinase (bacteriophytochrome)